MKKIIIAISFIVSNLTFAQFTVSASSKDWIEVGQYWGNIFLFKTDNKAKIIYKDVISQTQGSFDSFKSPLKRNIDGVKREIGNNSKGIIEGKQEFIFSIDDKTIDDLYTLIEKNFEGKIKEELTLDFPEGRMYLKFKNYFGNFVMQFGFDKNGVNKNSEYSKVYTQELSLNNIKKMFDKKGK